METSGNVTDGIADSINLLSRKRQPRGEVETMGSNVFRNGELPGISTMYLSYGLCGAGREEIPRINPTIPKRRAERIAREGEGIPHNGSVHPVNVLRP